MSKYYAHDSSVLENNVTIGDNTKIWHYCHVRENSIIGENVNIGKGVYIDSGVVVGNNVRIQNGVSLYKGVTIEDDVFLGPHCNFTNDLFPRANSKDWSIIPTLVRKGASIGSNATIICGVTIGEYTLVSVGAVVTEDTLPYSLMIGHPARLKGFVCRCGNRMDKETDLMIYQYKCSKCGGELNVNCKWESKLNF